MFEAKKVFATPHRRFEMMECNQIARAVDESPDQLIEYLNEVQNKIECTAIERSLCVVLRGILISMSKEKDASSIDQK